jgi:hypothetical protein
MVFKVNVMTLFFIFITISMMILAVIVDSTLYAINATTFAIFALAFGLENK